MGDVRPGPTASRREPVRTSAWPAMTGLVLCGGASTRMGTDKASLVVEGRQLVDRLAARVATVATPVWLAPGTVGRLGARGLPEVADAVVGSGPLGAIVAGLRALPAPEEPGAEEQRREPALLAVVAVDLVDASPALLARCAAVLGDHDAVVPVSDRGVEPLHAVYAHSALAALEQRLAAGRRSVTGALEDLRWHALPPSTWQDLDPSGTFATNLNSAEDLRARATAAPPTAPPVDWRSRSPTTRAGGASR